MKKSLLARALSVGAALALVVPTTIPAANAAEVHVPDHGLRKCINVHLGQPADAELAASDVASIGALDCSAIKRQRHYHILDLSGVEHLTGATRIDLGGNRIIDLEPLAGLTQLQHLDLDRNSNFSDLSPLSGLTQLQTLDLYSNEVQDLSPLAGLSNLRALNLGATHVEDLSVLAGFTRLEHLDLRWANVADLSALSGLTRLETLDLEDNGNVEDLSPLAGLTNLHTLDLWNTNVEDFSVLADLTALEALKAGPEIEDVSPFAGLTGLRTLDLGGNRITDASPLARIAEQDGVDLDLSGQSLTLTSTAGEPVVVPPLLDSSGQPAGIVWCHSAESTLSECRGLASTADGGTTFTPYVQSLYTMTFKGTGRDHYGLTAFVTVTGEPDRLDPSFSDNPAGSGFHTPIEWMATEGISVGYADGTFKKNRNVSRGETAQFLYRMTDQSATASQVPFTDVRQAYRNAVAWFADEEISVGYTDGTFRPNRPVTRGEFAAFLYRLEQPEDSDSPQRSPFTDVNTGGANAAAISWLDAAGIATGYGDGSFKPGQAISRAEAAAFLHRYHRLAQ